MRKFQLKYTILGDEKSESFGTNRNEKAPDASRTKGF